MNINFLKPIKNTFSSIGKELGLNKKTITGFDNTVYNKQINTIYNTNKKHFSHTDIENKTYILYDRFPKCMISCDCFNFNKDKVINWLDNTDDDLVKDNVLMCAEMYFKISKKQNT